MHNYFVDITEHADNCAPHEICGFLHFDGNGSMSYVKACNISSGETFAVAPADVVAAYARGSIGAFVHSHCQHDAVFSAADLENLERTQLPWLLYSTQSRMFNFRRPASVYPPFQGRNFIMGLNDCVGLASDYFAKFFNRPLPYFTRPLQVVERGFALDCVYLQNAGFELVKDTPRAHDVVLMQLGFNKPVNHVGVIVREGLLLHQVRGTVSAIEQYDGLWRRLTRFVFRHPEFTSKLPVL